MTSPLRIMMCTDAVGGVWVFATALARALARRGHSVHLVTLGPPPREDEVRALREVRGVSLECTDLELEWLDPEGRDRSRAHARLTAIERRVRPDVVHLNSYREACADWSSPVLVTAHSCVRSWWIACRGREPDEPRWSRYMANVKSGLAAATAWAAPSLAFRDAMQALYAPPSPGRVIANGIDLVQMAEPAHSPSERARYILAAGRLWDEAKNISLLVSAARGLDWPVRIAGATRSPDGSVASARDEGRAELLGELSRPNLLARMAEAEVFVAPSLYEPFGLSVAEAAASGCALVLSDIPTFRELWTGAALFFDPHDGAALRSTLAAVCRSEGLRAALRRAAFRRAARFGLARMATAYEGAYARLAAAAKRRAPAALPMEAGG